MSGVPAKSSASAVGNSTLTPTPDENMPPSSNIADDPSATWARKPFDSERKFRDFLAPDFILGTIQHLWTRDWSQTVWRNVFYIGLYHVLGIWGLGRFFSSSVSWFSRSWVLLLYYFSGLGVTAGMHRLWSHRSYKASPLLETFLACGASMSFENSIYVWSRDHRAHHKYSETKADPHDSHRGIFFAHVGWLLVKKHPEVTRLGKEIDMDDLKKNQIVMFQHNYYLPVMLLWTFLIPCLVPFLLWKESLETAFLLANLRLCLVHHGTWLVNSVSHWQGPHPYDNTIWPCENILTGLVALGEGWHNYHHRFPSDYRTSDRDFGVMVFLFNFTQLFLDTCAKSGLCWDMVKASPKLVKTVQDRLGDDRVVKS